MCLNNRTAAKIHLELCAYFFMFYTLHCIDFCFVFLIFPSQTQICIWAANCNTDSSKCSFCCMTPVSYNGSCTAETLHHALKNCLLFFD